MVRSPSRGRSTPPPSPPADDFASPLAAPAFEQAFPPEAGGKLTIHVVNNMVAVRAGKHRVEYTFAADAISVVAEGFEFTFVPALSIKAVLAPDNKGGPFARTGTQIRRGSCCKTA